MVAVFLPLRWLPLIANAFIVFLPDLPPPSCFDFVKLAPDARESPFDQAKLHHERPACLHVAFILFVLKTIARQPLIPHDPTLAVHRVLYSH
jgi:hypothetical protein